MGILSVVGTPIGNLGDMTYRAVETLEKADFICAEDTRVTAKLLNYFDIKTPLVSYHEHNAKQVGESILNRIMAGENAAIVTDAGMPCISDPGELLVKLCAENGVKVEVVPGPSAGVSALAISGLDTARFQFEGFLSTTKKQRLNHLASVKNCTNTLIFYEAPHKLIYTLKDMLEYFGDRRISLLQGAYKDTRRSFPHHPCARLWSIMKPTSQRANLCLLSRVQKRTSILPCGEYMRKLWTSKSP